MFENITEQIINLYSPKKILLFGSQARGVATDKSDIDLCVIMDTLNKRRALADMYYTIDSEKPIDFILYTPIEWEKCINDITSFAYKISTEGVFLYG